LVSGRKPERKGGSVEFMLLFTMRRGESPEPDGMRMMNALAQALADEGKLRRGAPLAPEAEAVRVRVRDGNALVHDGPYAESKEIVGGFWILDVADRAEAIEIAKRIPAARWGTVELHPLVARYAFPDPEKGTPWLFAFRKEPGLTDPDRAKLREMIAYGEALVASGKLFETAPLADDPPPARVEVRRGDALVIDGPFAEAKEAVAGYSIVRADDAAEAVAIAKRYPHAGWGPVEIRRILFLDRVSP
jgi:hypothetical protein